MDKKEISVFVLLVLLSSMLGAYGVAPYYCSPDFNVGDGYVTFSYCESCEEEMKDKELFVFFSKEGWPGLTESVESLRFMPFINGKDVYYPLDETLDSERISICYQNGKNELVLLQEFLVKKNGKIIKAEENEAFSYPQSPCYEYGERTVDLAERLWEKSCEDEDMYVMEVFRFLSEMEYDYELAENPRTETMEEYVERMDLEKVLEKNMGICREKANLMVALLRLKNIPCKVVLGYSEEKAVGHAWNKVYVDDKWIMIDATNSVMGSGVAEKDRYGLYEEEWSY